MKLSVVPGLTACVLAAFPAFAREPLRPAELPPAAFQGQQYVDSRGCMFVRAGTAAKVLWVPRVSRDGQPQCSAAPSGKRVPVAGEGAATAVEPVTTPATNAAEASTAVASGGYFVAVGSFGVAENADKAETRLRGMDYGVVRGRLQGGGGSLVTVFAGPFADAGSANAARQTLRDAGFPDAIVIGP
jgi:cell division septation protein DedD